MNLFEILLLTISFGCMWYFFKINLENFANKLLANNAKIMQEYLHSYNNTLKALHNLEQILDENKQHNHNSKILN